MILNFYHIKSLDKLFNCKIPFIDLEALKKNKFQILFTFKPYLLCDYVLCSKIYPELFKPTDYSVYL